jgi:hypothetical protein
MKQILKSTIRKFFGLAGLEVKRKPKDRIEEPYFVENQVVPNIWKRPVYTELVPFRLLPEKHPVVLLGSSEERSRIRPAIAELGIEVVDVEWDWERNTVSDDLNPNALIVLCKLPMNEEHWRTTRRLKEQFGSRVIGLQELVLPFTTIRQAQDVLGYYIDTLEKIAPYYLGKEFFGPLDELNKAFPLAGKTVIEFGPMDGAQTAGLVNLGARSVTCIEARAESFIKTMVARYAFRWDNVHLVMDDFHNADKLKYGRFDLAFAHGVYYHSVAPFFFFENLMSLSSNIFIGGYTYADSNSSSFGEWDTLLYSGKKYVVKKIPMGQSYNTGVNKYGYHFCRDDMLSFFTERDYKVTVITDEETADPWGDRYLRFLACKK